MPITRGQMKRQLYMGGGIMNAVPREQYGLGSVFKGAKKAVKGAVKTVKKIAKSDLGKAALLAAGGAYALGLGPFGGAGALSGIRGAGFARGLFPSIMDYKTPTRSFFTELGKIGSKGLGKITGGGVTGNLGKLATLGAVSTFLTSKYGMTEEEAQEEVARDPSTYLRMYYTNLNPNAGSEEIEEFVATNISEYATGGRVGFAEGTYKDFEEFMKRRSEAMSEREKEELRKQFEMYMRSKDPTVEAAEGGRIGFANGPVLPPDPTQPVNPFGPKPGDFGIDEDIPIKMASNIENDKILEALFEKYLDMGLSPKDAAKAAQEEFDRMSKRKMEPTIRGVAALGGRMGFDKGTKRKGLQSILDELDDDDDYGDKIVILTYDKFGRGQLKLVPKSEAMPEGAVDIPRRRKAKGDTASMNAMQAAGVEGLPVRQNPKGVKELDLRKTGGFIPPVGIKEKADDIPAMLSNNEFVFTADAVRGAGGGDVNLGAQRMYDTMKRLEAGGKA